MRRRALELSIVQAELVQQMRQMKFTPVALAIALLPGLAVSPAWAQPAPANNQAATSADVPEAKSLFETGGQADIGPRPFNSFLARIASPVDKITLVNSADNLPADGVGSTDIRLQLLAGSHRRLSLLGRWHRHLREHCRWEDGLQRTSLR